MGECLRAKTVKWGEREERLIAEIKREAQPFEVSTSHVVRVAIRRLYVSLCTPGTLRQDAPASQELQGVTGSYRRKPGQQRIERVREGKRA